MVDTKFIYKLSVLVIVFLLTEGVANAQLKSVDNAQAALVHKIDSILQGQVDESKIPGAVIEIKRGDTVIYKHAYGFAQKFNYRHELLADPEKMTAEHMFDIASLTKVVGTTTSIMLLVDKGVIKVDDPVGKYIKAFTTPDKAGITIRHLLTHTAGLYEWYPLYYRASNEQETFKLIGELPLAFPVGAQRKYSDLGFTILGEIVETVSGQSLDQFEEQNIFKPLGMTHTMYNPLQKNKDFKIASTSFGNPYEHRMVYDPDLGYQFKEIKHNQWNGWRHYILKGEVNDGNAWYAEKGVAGAAGIFSTVDDIQKLVDMLKNKGKVGDIQFISVYTINTFLTKDKFNNGLGWMMDPENSFMKNGPEGTFGHTGFTGTSICVVPSTGVSIILLINRQQMGLIENKEYYNVNAIRAQVFKAMMAYCKAN
ncbi:serine hydrolase [uncultured Mucilaginibacter sp.]|uniref:serine hydrolase domain-containing protein n=1 Tax=uncultured Mucilaginibacter sp. TaxID=797541 RepID=UPI0025FF0853|nr:serine hydrolase [uncultured Mucilaginibacter sp.]